MIYIIMIISLAASVIGAICGIGGGVIIKPVLDSLGIMGVSAGSYLSGFTVLCMSFCSVSTNLVSKRTPMRMKVCVPVSIGSAIGGIIGKSIFNCLKSSFSNTEFIGRVQAASLAVLNLGALIYFLQKKSIRSINVNSRVTSLIVGSILGLISSFLGIGGGPFNLVVLSFFFSMETKEAAQTSLFIILFAQFTSLGLTMLTRQIPEIDVRIMLGMACMGIAGACIGSRLNKKMKTQTVEKLFVGLSVGIICICIYNMFHIG